jgi:NAD(P)-dependent dehydrogenase (short-subunit alcohol dehydrogenase family)
MSDVGFEGRVAIITGAGGGLGREHALLMASRGAQIVVNDLGGAVDGTGSDAGPAQKVVEEIEALGGAAVADGNSVATQEGAEGMVKTALEAFGRVDIVINNAGILRDKSFANMTPDLWDPVIAVHLTGTYNVTRAAWSHFREQSYGRIVSTSSAAGIFGNFGQTNYGAAKMGIVGMTRVWAQEGTKYNIRANAIAPVARTRMTEEILGPLIEKVDPALVSPVVAYLASEECAVSGEVYSVGAGRVSRIFIAEAPGYFKKDLTIEDVRHHPCRG